MKKLLSFILLFIAFNTSYAFEETIPYEEICFDLEGRMTTLKNPGMMNCNDPMADFWLSYSPSGLGEYPVVIQNCVFDVAFCGLEMSEIAYSYKEYNEVDFTDVSSLPFTIGFVDIDFSTVTIILRTTEGNYYKLGFIEEEDNCPYPSSYPTCIRFQWDELLSNPPDPSTCEPATYSPENKEIIFDRLAMELYNPFTDEPNGQFALFEGSNMRLSKLTGADDFKYKGENPAYSGQSIANLNNCYPTYSASQGTVRFPRIRVPLIGILLDGNTVSGPMICYGAILKQSMTQAKIFGLTTIYETSCQ